jgi:Uma2 family endonuclease
MATVTMPQHGFTVADLDGFPSDSNRYELIDGSLHVTPAPSPLHQRAARRLYDRLAAACPAELEIFWAPLDIVLSPATVLEPDLLVLPVVTGPERRVEETPLLTVEVLSPTTQRYDLHTKRVVYRDAGVPAYWVVDPGVGGGPVTLTAWHWADGQQTERTWSGDEEASLDWPFPVTIVPARLVLPRG